MMEYIRPDYQAAFSQLARRFTMLDHMSLAEEKVEVNHIITEAMKLIEAVEKAELMLRSAGSGY